MLSTQSLHHQTVSSLPAAEISSHSQRLTLDQAWPLIQSTLARTFDFSVASIRPDGHPHVTPIGSLMLRPDRTGIFIEKFTSTLPNNLEHDDRVCVYGSKTSVLSMLHGMLRGRATRPMGVRLFGRVGPRRPLTDQERAQFEHKVRWFAWTKGYDALWSDLTSARDITFDDYQPIIAGKFTRGHWRRPKRSERDDLAACAVGSRVAAHPDIAPLLIGIDHFDVHTFEGKASLEEFIAKMLTLPGWVRALFGFRAVFAKILGLRTDDRTLRDADELGLAPGKYVSFFESIAYEPGRFWVGGEEVDPHLSAWLVITADPSGEGANRFRVATIVRYKDWRGPLYMNAILPFHHLIVWALGRRAAQAG